jgi:hypothetical protein
MTVEEFRQLALELPEAIESEHHDHPDFRVRKKVFATLIFPDAATGMVKLTPDQQGSFVRTAPEVFAPAKGGWGERGATLVHLAHAEEPIVRSALATAWRNVAPKKLAATLDFPD